MPTVIEEKDKIREVLAEYCFNLDGGHFANMAALFTLDGTWDTAFGKASGRAAIAQLAQDIRAKAGPDRPRAVHLVANIAIDLHGDRALVRSNWVVIQNGPAGPAIGSAGAYDDEMVNEGGEWRFHYRKIDRFIAG